MEESVEVSAKTVDEAIDSALEELGLKRSQVQIEILTGGKPGLFGLGGEQARVRVTALEAETARPAPSEEIPPEIENEMEVEDLQSPGVELAVDNLIRILELAEIDADVFVRRPETPGDGLGRASAVLDIEGDDLGLLIGRRGTTLSALQYLINLMINRNAESQVLVSVDVERYHRRREETLNSLAERMAEHVRQTDRAITLEPMPPAERRIIHMALAEDPDVSTGSVGSGDGRKVVIRPGRSPQPSI
ncbi:MAG: RNA-binding cell elongation regulator Jag/EloR [Dehalococcoidia bacterium]